MSASNALLREAADFVGKSKCSVGHPLQDIRNNAKARRCIYCEHQVDLWDRLSAAIQQPAHEPCSLPGLLSTSFRPDLPQVEFVARFESMEHAQAARGAFDKLALAQPPEDTSLIRREVRMDEKTVDYVAECRRLEKAVALLESQLQHETRVIAVLVAVGKLKQGHVEEARSIVSSLGD